jgi:tetratricopeptide (TPR) repeat protein
MTCSVNFPHTSGDGDTQASLRAPLRQVVRAAEPSRRAAMKCSLVIVAVSLAMVSSTGCGMVAHRQNAQGVQLYQQGYYQQAIAKFQQATTTDPQDADSFYNMAATYHRMGKLNNNNKADLAQAESLYNQCLDRSQPDAGRSQGRTGPPGRRIG